MIKACEICGTTIVGAPQRRFCRPCRNKRCGNTIRTLKPGERVPDGAPRRHPSDHGYIRLRWKVGTKAYVETYEHRVIDGRVTTEEHVHHVNGVRTDNRPENLRPMSAEDHSVVHGDPVWWVRAARLYTSGLSTYQVGKRLTRDPASVYRALVKMGVPLRKEARIAIPRHEREGR
jgi:HNH endonuclease